MCSQSALVHTTGTTQYAHDEGGRFCLRNTCQQLATSQSAARFTAQTNQTTFHQHRHTSHRSVHTQQGPSITAPPTARSAVSTGQSFLSKPTAYPKHPLSSSLRRVLPLLYNHFNVYCLYCAITSTCTVFTLNHFNVIAFTVQSFQSVLPLLYNHFNVYCLYCTITSTCTASTVQSLKSVRLNCTITSPCTASTLQSLRPLLPLLYNHFMYCLYCTITPPCTVSTA